MADFGFGGAIALLKENKKVAHRAWTNGEYLTMIGKINYYDANDNVVKTVTENDIAFVNGVNVIPSWYPANEELFAEDWYEIAEPILSVGKKPCEEV